MRAKGYGQNVLRMCEDAPGAVFAVNDQPADTIVGMEQAAVERVRAPRRVVSVDVVRGLTIAFMVLVNDPGDWGHVYGQLDHANWSGLTMTDLVFPNFLFLIGVSIVFSLESRIARGEDRWHLAMHIVRRALIIFALDLFLSGFPEFELGELRLFGVLTRIAVCYCAVALICLATRKLEHLAGLAAALLIGYWVLMRFVPVPGFGVPTHDVPMLDRVGNLTSHIDRGFTAFTQRTLHVGRLYRHTSDPEGVLSTLPAIATVLFGAMAGVLLRREGVSAGRKRNLMALAGVVFVAAGVAWSFSFPFNKNLWTSSYALVAGGISLLLLALAYWMTDMGRQAGASTGRNGGVKAALLWPWLVFGSNAIVAYCFSELLVEVLGAIKIHAGSPTALIGWIYLHGFSHGHSTRLTSLAFALCYVGVCFVPNYLLWRKRIFVKI